MRPQTVTHAVELEAGVQSVGESVEAGVDVLQEPGEADPHVPGVGCRLVVVEGVREGRAARPVAPVHQEDRPAGVSHQQGGEGQHPAGAGEGLQEAVDHDHDVSQVLVEEELADTVLGLVVGEVERVQLAGGVLSPEEDVRLDDVATHGQGLVEEGRGEPEGPVNV